MKKGAKIKTPKKEYIKAMKDKNGETYYSFLYNKNAKNKDSGEWEIIERYVVNVMNLELFGEEEIEINDFLETKPQINKDKKGREYLNCLVWVKASMSNANNNDNTYNPNEQTQHQSNSRFNYDDTEDDLPF